MNDSKTDPYQNYHKGMSKLLSGDIIKKNYPMIDHVDVFVVDDLSSIYFRVSLNDGSINSENIYNKGYDPHFIGDKFRRYMKYFGIPTHYRDTMITQNPSGTNIHVYSF